MSYLTFTSLQNAQNANRKTHCNFIRKHASESERNIGDYSNHYKKSDIDSMTDENIENLIIYTTIKGKLIQSKGGIKEWNPPVKSVSSDDWFFVKADDSNLMTNVTYESEIETIPEEWIGQIG